MNDREMELEDLITSRSGDVLRLKAKADAAMPEMAKVWRDEARRAASDVARLVALREPATVARMEADRGLAAGCAGCGEACQARQDRLGERRLTRFRR